MHEQHRLLAREQRDRREVLHRVVGQLRVERGADRVRVRGEQQRVAVGRRFHHLGAAEHRALAGLVLHHHLLAELLRHLLRDHAHRAVGGAAGRIRHHHPDRARGIVLGERRAGGEASEGEDERSHAGSP